MTQSLSRAGIGHISTLRSAMLHFPRDEFDLRIAAARLELDRRGLDALLIFAQESHYYLTGYDTGGYKFFQSAVLTADDTPITLMTRRPDLHQARLTSIIEDIRIWWDGNNATPALDLKAILEEKGLKGRRIGVELATHGLTAANWEMLRRALDGWCTFVDASDLIGMQRMVKSPAELVFMRKAAEMADAAVTAVRGAAAPDVGENLVELAASEAVLRAGGEINLAKVILSSGPHAMLTRVASGYRTLRSGEQLTCEWAGIYRRYHAGIFRTFSIGKAPQRHKDLFQITRDSLDAMTAAARPGNPIGNIDREHRRVFDEHGYEKQRQPTAGYSVGATFPPKALPDAPPLLYADNPMIAEPGMTFFLHAVFSDQDTGDAMMLGHTILITETGHEILNKVPCDYLECL
ncbi:Xaa-Pro peptidase family protein [Paracoccus onubensis]|uniref:M24 family metallopeptidase n=1 Tax=Paracoccus onubensis TaxID=1675788 RepID=UPI00273126BE|nr:Xaa-Pro peptidase family protein [Paracoccus onubensis]MDP0930060.1 Xaa-Pro peptidase family protein [Paracoccus onubensis]